METRTNNRTFFLKKTSKSASQQHQQAAQTNAFPLGAAHFSGSTSMLGYMNPAAGMQMAANYYGTAAQYPFPIDPTAAMQVGLMRS